MYKFQGFMLLLLLLVSVPLAMAARPISSLPDQQRNSNIFAVLGVVCECCNGTGGECSSTWTQPCPQLKCLPWKLH
ncbi:hypothetical protein HRI_000644000 [Hibiscus trionum]|uniref:Uncharacterized protein n=1 Tax=Hibiscus trionum TaxID=183268 RepID=A0A9W7H308_HIBTR|nr:hypothetical protein HRI_000644000 [Hibiscus trionum]